MYEDCAQAESTAASPAAVAFSVGWMQQVECCKYHIFLVMHFHMHFASTIFNDVLFPSIFHLCFPANSFEFEFGEKCHRLVNFHIINISFYGGTFCPART